MPSLQDRFSTLTEGEKERFLLVAIHSRIVDTDWDAAAKEYGKSTPASLRAVFQRSLKKISGKANAGATDGEAANATGAAKDAKAGRSNAVGRKKRKNGEEDNGGQGNTSTNGGNGGKNTKRIKHDVADADKVTTIKTEEEEEGKEEHAV